MRVEVSEVDIFIVPESEEDTAALKRFKGRAPFEVFNDMDGINVHELCTAGLTPDQLRYYQDYFRED